MRYIPCALSAVIGAATIVAAQSNQSSGAIQQTEEPVATLEFNHPEQTFLGRRGTVMSAEQTCAEDGSLFIEIADSLENIDLVLHSLKSATDDVRFSADNIQGYTNISPPIQYFVNDRNVAVLVEADPKSNPLEQKRQSSPIKVELVLIYDRKSVLEYIVPVPRDIDAKTVGLYGSGDILVVAMDKTTKVSRFIVIDTDGNIKNEFLPFDNDYNTNKNAVAMQPLAGVNESGAFISLQVIPHGENLLLFPRMTSHAVIEINEQGVVRSVQLHLPSGYTLSSFLSASPSSWKIKTFAKAESRTDASGNSYGVLQEGPVFEFNPYDGSVIRRIDMPKDSTARVVCEHNGDYIALTTDPKSGRLEMLKGFIPR